LHDARSRFNISFRSAKISTYGLSIAHVDRFFQSLTSSIRQFLIRVELFSDPKNYRKLISFFNCTKLRLKSCTVTQVESFTCTNHCKIIFKCLKLFGKKNYNLCLNFNSFRCSTLSMTCTVPVKCKLTVSTRSSKLDSRVSNVETFEFRDARTEDRESSIEFRESRNTEFSNMQTRKELRENNLFLEG